MTNGNTNAIAVQECEVAIIGGGPAGLGGVVDGLLDQVERMGPVAATRGDFTDYQGRHTVAGRANWQFQAIEGGALPYFEDLPGFASRLDPFWA